MIDRIKPRPRRQGDLFRPVRTAVVSAVRGASTREPALLPHDVWPPRYVDPWAVRDKLLLQSCLGSALRRVVKDFDQPLGLFEVVAYADEKRMRCSDSFLGRERPPEGVVAAYDPVTASIRVTRIEGKLVEKRMMTALTHELVHRAVHVIGKHGVPAFLNEGLALWRSQDLPPSMWKAFARARSLRNLFPLTGLDKPPTKHATWRHGHAPDVAEAQSVAIVEVLTRDPGGWPRVLRLLRRLGQGPPVEPGEERVNHFLAVLAECDPPAASLLSEKGLIPT